MFAGDHEWSAYEFDEHGLDPPIGPNYLRHLFKHPEEHDNERLAYSAFPKCYERLEMGPGWGVEFVEGFVPKRVVMAVFSLILLTLGVYSVSIACEVRSAVGVATFSLAAGCLSLIWAQIGLT